MKQSCPICGSANIETEACCITVNNNTHKSTYGFRSQCCDCQAEFITGTGIKKERDIIISGNLYPEIDFENMNFDNS